MKVKQVLVIRKDLNMRRGKECAQASHGSCMWMADRWRSTQNIGFLKRLWRYLTGHNNFNEPETAWLTGKFTKVVLQVNSEEELLTVYNKAVEKKLMAFLVTDSGVTEFDGVPTHTVVAIGPNYEEEFIGVTDNLKLY